MDPMVGSSSSMISEFDALGSNSNSASCLINLCSLCNLQFTDSNLNENGSERTVERILDIFLSDNDEHDQVQLCSNCKLLCANLICARQSLLLLIDKITTLLLQNSRFTLVNPKYKIIPKLFQFRFTKPVSMTLPFVNPVCPPAESLLQTNFPMTNNNKINDNITQFHSPLISNINQHADSQFASQRGINSVEATQSTPAPATSPELPDLTSSILSTLDNHNSFPNFSNDQNNVIQPNMQGTYKSNSDTQFVQMPTMETLPLVNSINSTIPQNVEQENLFSFHFNEATTIESNKNMPESVHTFTNIEQYAEPDLTIHNNQNSLLATDAEIVKLENLKEFTESSDKLTPLICGICGKSYRKKRGLKAHLALHQGEIKYQCKLCDKIFTQKCGLKRHLPIHTGERAFQCNQCDKTFKHHTSFNLHKLTHSGKKRFSCRSCDSTFFSTSHLRRHQKCHTGNKPFSCTICPRAFSEKYNLDAHIRTHTEETPFKCKYCPKGFNRKNKLEMHLNRSHSNLGDQ